MDSRPLEVQFEELRAKLVNFERELLEYRSVHISRRGADGPRGERGERGATGATGAAGHNPRIVIGSVVAGENPSASLRDGVDGVQILDLVLPRGERGATGADSSVPGPAGPKGERGEIGPKGDKGADSHVPGPIGPRGETGPVGLIGPKGDKGDRGDTGPAGVGRDGVDGKPGATGPQGPEPDFTYILSGIESRLRRIWKSDIQSAIHAEVSKVHT